MTRHWRCGYVEPVAWRGSKWNPDWEIADLLQFRQFNSIVAEALEHRMGEGNGIEDGDYYYWRQPKNPHIVHRIPLEIYRANGNRCRGKGSYLETQADPFQQKLSEKVASRLEQSQT